MQVAYVGPHVAVEIPLDPGNEMSAWLVAERDGEPVDLPEKYAKRLVAEQPSNWAAVAKPAKRSEP